MAGQANWANIYMSVLYYLSSDFLFALLPLSYPWVWCQMRITKKLCACGCQIWDMTGNLSPLWYFLHSFTISHSISKCKMWTKFYSRNEFQIIIYRIFGSITSIFELWLWPISKDFWLTTPLHVTDLLSGNVLRYFAPPIPW